MSNVILSTQGLSRHFGALTAVDSVTLAFDRGQIHAIIGPNGAGKTTLINMLSGQVRPSAGTVCFKNQDITHARADQISRLGIGRSFQKTNLFPTLSCFENCRLAASARLTGSARFFRPVSTYDAVDRRAEEALNICGLSTRRDAIAAEISHGEQRQLEIATMLATGPELLLLDEPLAGIGAEESKTMVRLLRRLAADHTLVLIEHDMDAVFAIADRLTVMANGRVLETGAVETVRASAVVREAYLGIGDERS